VGAAVRVHHDAFSACQALADIASRHREGAVTVSWLVEANGSVDEVTVGHSTFETGAFNACVLSVARLVTFPPSPAPSHISWTVKFRGPPNAALAERNEQSAAAER
jgi:TonB family protein